MLPVRLSLYTRLAADAVGCFVKRGELMPLPERLPIELTRQRACYITILERPGRRLRGLFGRALPAQPTLAHEIAFNAVQAAVANPLRRLRRADLAHVQYSVSLLSPLQRIYDPQQLNPSRFGLYLQSDRGKEALLLPRRAGVDTAEDQIATALREAGINPRAETVTLYRFDVEHHE